MFLIIKIMLILAIIGLFDIIVYALNLEFKWFKIDSKIDKILFNVLMGIVIIEFILALTMIIKL